MPFTSEFEISDPLDLVVRRYWRDPNGRHAVIDQALNVKRPKAAAFKLRRDEKGLSGNLWSLLIADGQDSGWQLDQEKFFAFVLSIEAFTKADLRVFHDPIEAIGNSEANPYHVEERGLRKICDEQEDLYERVRTGLAKASRIVAE